MELNTSQAEAPVLSIVVPVYNEADNVEPTVRALHQHVPVSFEIIAVYDYDEDPTVPVLERLSGEFPTLRTVKNQVARGPSGALRTGFEHARGARVLVVMADLCDDFGQIKDLLELVPAKADIACPSRYCPGGRQELKPSLKVWAPRAAGALLRLLAGIPTYDPTNSFKLYSAEVLRNIRMTSTVSFSVTLEIVAKAHCLGFRIAEIPTTWRDRRAGKSNFHLWRSIAVYTPWFCVAMMRGKFLRLPESWLRGWFGTRRVLACEQKPALKA